MCPYHRCTNEYYVLFINKPLSTFKANSATERNDMGYSTMFRKRKSIVDAASYHCQGKVIKYKKKTLFWNIQFYSKENIVNYFDWYRL